MRKLLNKVTPPAIESPIHDQYQNQIKRIFYANEVWSIIYCKNHQGTIYFHHQNRDIENMAIVVLIDDVY